MASCSVRYIRTRILLPTFCRLCLVIGIVPKHKHSCRSQPSRISSSFQFHLKVSSEHIKSNLCYRTGKECRVIGILTRVLYCRSTLTIYIAGRGNFECQVFINLDVNGSFAWWWLTNEHIISFRFNVNRIDILPNIFWGHSIWVQFLPKFLWD